VSHDESCGKHLRVMSSLPDQAQRDAFTTPIPIPSGRRIELRADVDFARLRFAYRLDGDDWRQLPEELDASILSDEATAPDLPNFTGAFVGMACQDLSGSARPADFDYFEYHERG
jgi:xylan 1,4-beta-xylosidase